MNTGHEDLEHVVATARRDQQRHDAEPPLFRWIHNYADRRDIVLHKAHLHVVERDAKGWRVEIYKLEADQPFSHFYVHGRAPAPPVLEYRPPAPQPVRPRWRVPAPRKVEGYDRLLADVDRKILEALMVPNIPAATPPSATLPAALLEAMARFQMEEVARLTAFYEPLLRVPSIVVEDPPAAERLWTRLSYYGSTPIWHEQIVRIDSDGPATEPMKRPPPATSKRN